MRNRRAATPTALFISLVAHLALTWSLFEKVASLPILRPEPEAMFAEIVEPPPPAKMTREIAPPSQAPEVEHAPENARPGERNTMTEKEQVKRGEDLPPPAPRPSPQPQTQPVVAPPKEAPRPASRASSPPSGRGRSEKRAIPRLTLGESEVLAQLGPGTAEPAQRNGEGEEEAPKESTQDRKPGKVSDQEREIKLRSVDPFRKNFSLSSIYPGVSDVVQNVPDGEITLLNEKADQFAVFVRRVALQVFGALRRSAWGTLPYSEVEGITKFSRIRAVMSREGKFIRVEPLDGSGSFLFDDILKGAAEKGVNDQNPPLPALASDGSFHFIFLARTWARRMPNGLPEQRWLVLGTGLE